MLPDVRRVDRATCPDIAKPVLEYWIAKCGNRAMPARADIDPLDLQPQLWSYLQLVDVVDDDRRYVYRLSGTSDVRARGHDPRGKSVKEAFWGPNAEDALGCYDRVAAERVPIIDPLPYKSDSYTAEFTLFMPLSDDGQTVNMIMVFSTYCDMPAGTGL